MGLVLSAANASVCGMLSFLLAWMVLSTKVQDGIVIKAGLIAMALAFALLAYFSMDPATAWDGERFQRATLLLGVGIGVVIVGYLWRAHRAGHQIRRASDFADFDSRPMEHIHDPSPR